jgi:hypothetical protein
VRAAALAGALIAGVPGVGTGCPAVAENRAAMDDFTARVRRWGAQRTVLEQELPPLVQTADREAIEAHRRALAARVLAAGTTTSLFTDRTRALFRRLVAEAARQRGVGATRAVVLDDNPGGVPPAARRPYPAGAPLATVPPAVLKALPSLPHDIEYRFVGRHLVVRDVATNLVLDVVPDALP